MCCGGQTNDEKARFGIAEAGYRAAPVGLVAERRALRDGNLLTMAPEARTPLA
jgi:hypothetical protein